VCLTQRSLFSVDATAAAILNGKSLVLEPYWFKADYGALDFENQ
jgi:hypothetical protein